MIIALDLFGSFVYESKTTLPVNTPNDNYTDKLQFARHEEGRIRALLPWQVHPASKVGVSTDLLEF